MTKLRDQVKKFMKAIQQGTPDTPQLPTPGVLKLRARLIIEEAFEFVEAMYSGDEHSVAWLTETKKTVLDGITDTEPKTPDFPGMVDAVGDLMVVSEGANLAFGVDGEKILDAIMHANMQKVSGPTDEHGKRQKPPGWKAPDIEYQLRHQGWGTPPKDPRECSRCGDTVGCGCMCH